MKRALVISALASALVLGAGPASALLAAPSTVPTSARLSARTSIDPPRCPAVTKRVSGARHQGINATNRGGTWELRGAVWRENTPDPIEYPVRSEAWTRGCIIGGAVFGSVPKRWTRDQWYNGDDGGERMGGEVFRQTLTDTPGNFLVIRNTYAEDFEDAYDPNAARWDSTTYLDHVHAKYIRDDGIENEQTPHNMVVRNSLFDGVFTMFAERPKGSETARNGSGPQFLKVVRSLVYVKPQPLGPEYCDSESVELGRCTPTKRKNVWRGSYGIWKWSEDAAHKVVVRNTIFRLDQPSYSSCQPQLWPAGRYKNVTLVWAGKGRYRNAGGCHNTLPKGVHLTTDVGVWRRAKRAWLRG
ncbi:MAG TPA: hypothetical protein VFG63_00210 [Nocardioidaceae bacterium]|nr:hypothetical protein [Nocardioidaceae bacterium]